MDREDMKKIILGYNKATEDASDYYDMLLKIKEIVHDDLTRSYKLTDIREILKDFNENDGDVNG